jgi:glutamyl-Q tRNA(Asp) synthetase
MTQNFITRFAPSPTGFLHLGHAWSAMLAHDAARRAGGCFLLRIEDIDEVRCRADYVDAIYRDLEWLGLGWDGPVVLQSARAPLYQDALTRLVEMGLAYRCWCTRAEVAASAVAPHEGEGSLYPGTCKGRRELSDGRPFCWRLDANAACTAVGPLAWHEGEAESIRVDIASQGDVVIARKDALSSYHLAVTVDDAAQGVTHVVRGRDLFSSTHVHRVLQAVLGLAAPLYEHHRLITGVDGTRLAKRKQSPSIASLRNAGTDPLRLMSGMREGRFPIGFAVEGA